MAAAGMQLHTSRTVGPQQTYTNIQVPGGCDPGRLANPYLKVAGYDVDAGANTSSDSEVGRSRRASMRHGMGLDWGALKAAPFATCLLLGLLLFLGLVLPTGGRPSQPWLAYQSNGAESASTATTPAPLPKPPPEQTPAPLSAVAAFGWMLMSYAVAVHFMRLTAGYKKNGVSFDYTAMRAQAIAGFFEGTGFLFLTLNFWRPNPMLRVTALTIQILGGGAYLVQALSFRWAGQEFHATSLWTRSMGLACVLAVLFPVLYLTQHLVAARLMFLGWFEPPLVIGVIASMCLAASSSGREGTVATTYTQGFLVLWGAHLLTVVQPMVPFLASKPVIYPVTRFLSAVGLFVMIQPFQEMVELGMLSPKLGTSRAVATKELLEAHEERYKNKVGVTTFLNPEHMFSFAALLVMVAYAGSSLCLFLIAKPDMGRDVILHLYHTYHPCVLLDYLPGTLWAQPFFIAAAMIQIACMIVCLIRASLYGDVLLMVVFSFAAVWYTICALQFGLVFTFNPTQVSVLAHSVPYMIMATGSCAFASAYIYGLWRMKTDLELAPKRLVFATVQVALYVLGTTYGMFFMLKMLLDNLGMGASAGTAPAALEDTTAGDGLDQPVTFDPKAMILAIIMQFLVYSIGYTSPLRPFPVICELTTREGNAVTSLPPIPKAAPAEPVRPEGLSLRVSAKLPLQVATSLIAALLPVQIWLSWAVHGRDVLGKWGWHEFAQELPSGAVSATIWVAASGLFCMHGLLTATHEVLTNPDTFMRSLTLLMAWMLALASLVAHGATIPQSPGWYHGFEAFCLIFGAWALLDALLVLRSGRKGALETVEICLGAGVAVAFLHSAWAQNNFAHTLTICTVFSWAFVDARGVEIQLTGLRIADAVDMIDTPYAYAHHIHAPGQPKKTGSP